jgi:hypothetical protein
MPFMVYNPVQPIFYLLRYCLLFLLSTVSNAMILGILFRYAHLKPYLSIHIRYIFYNNVTHLIMTAVLSADANAYALLLVAGIMIH